MNIRSQISSKPILAQQTIVICGASSGIGRATALEFAKKGCSLILVARRKNVLEELSEECLLTQNTRFKKDASQIIPNSHIFSSLS